MSFKPTPSCQILFVEDDPDIRETLADLLRDEGHEVCEAASAEEGLARLRDASFDVVLTDYNLPGQSGAWMIEQAEQQDCLAGAIPLLLTASSHLVGTIGLRVLTKPIDIDELCREIESACASSRSQPQTAPRRLVDHAAVQLVLFVHGDSPRAARSQETLRKLLRAYGVSDSFLRLVDVSTPEGVAEAERERVAFTPALLRASPLPRRWIVGDMGRGAAVARLLQESRAGERND